MIDITLFLFYYQSEVTSMKYEIGTKIKNLRESRGLSQKSFAQKIGVSSSRVSNWEQGVNRPDIDYIVTICRILQISADELLGVDLREDGITASERQLICSYRNNRDLQVAVRILLGLEQPYPQQQQTRQTKQSYI